MTFNVGAKVVHPAYGPGKIMAITRKRFLDQVREYYVIRVPTQRLRVMVPTSKAEEVGLRPISKPGAFKVMWATLRDAPQPLPDDWKERKQAITNSIASGKLCELARATRDLAALRQERTLGSTDRELLDKAESALANELALAKDMEPKRALALIQSEIPRAAES